MSRLAGLAAVLLLIACGCSQPEEILDPTTESLVQLRAGNYDDSIRLASEAIQESPKNAAAYLYRGRAYYYRAAMGDANRAIEDLSQSIRLAPDSSDAYYSRALIYRELGQTDLAEKDDSRARALDHLAKDVMDKLPDAKNPAELVKLKPVDPEEIEEKQPRAKTAAEMLRDSGGPTSLSSEPGESSGLGTSLSGSEAASPHAVESEFNKQYRALLGQAGPGEEPMNGAAPATDLFGRPLEQSATAPLTAQPGATSAALPSAENPAAMSSGARSAGGWSRSAIPPVQSPFARQQAPAGMGSVPGALPMTQSPFPQANRGATGYVPPVSPFGGRGGQASGAASVSRPFSGSPGAVSRPQNNAVRPLYPRDYTP